ncbi:MAG TPA: type IV secretory system conjugative DNA transfer family protein [Clostridiaceae bacterium]|nr:type IV secretory system conjugative DNA transfer family protein [Clostridiaceae bacterium]
MTLNGELLRDCGYSLKKKGYTIKVLNLDDKSSSDCYNPLMYIKENHNNIGYYDNENPIQEDDVMSLINTIMANTKSDNIQNTSGDPFWEKAEMIYLQALFYYTIRHYDKAHQNFTTVLNLIRLSNPDSTGVSNLDRLFDAWEKEEPEAIGVKQYKHFKVAASAPKMMSTIIMVATARLASFNIKEIANMTDTDTMELNRIGMPLDDNSPLLKQINSESNKHIGNGKIAYFVITKPSNNTFNYLASIFYTQLFEIIDENAKLCGGSLATPVEIYMDEWAQLGEIPRFVEELAYLRGLNVGITVGLQSLSQLKQKYKDSWESVLDCCDSTLFLGGMSKETLEYLVALLGKKTWYKKSSGRTYARQGSSSTNWDVVGRELATLDELSKMPGGNCVLFIAGIGAFYSKLYNLKEHPNYSELYEPRDKNYQKLYDHKKELQYGENADYKMLCDSGLSFAIPIEKPKIIKVDKDDLKELKRMGIIRFEDLIIKK